MSADRIIAEISRDSGLPVDPHEPISEELQERIDLILHKLKFTENKPAVACIEWLDPLMVAGNLIPDMVNVAGGIPVMIEENDPAAYITWEDLRLQDPTIIIVMVRGVSIERTLKEIDSLLQLPNFTDLQAIKNKRLYLADGEKYFYTAGEQLVDTIEILAEIIYPKQFIFGYEGEGWIRFDV
jgi:iron complex transport system substrate-binding protein